MKGGWGTEGQVDLSLRLDHAGGDLGGGVDGEGDGGIGRDTAAVVGDAAVDALVRRVHSDNLRGYKHHNLKKALAWEKRGSWFNP